MDDNDYVCPLCCEELDISDRQFFPCKCGYQVCMWCWHRIRETESGLCPACRTPYGDDPHAFSAVDVEEVLKANKEKAAAEKRRAAAEAKAAAEAGSDSETVNTATSGGVGPMALPKDRTQLANMRVIRRNLVYAVGLPPTLGSEEALRKPEYFGQYGRISKIVVNRNNATGDLRRASTSAYVTFVHKEDTLSCILALDSFFIDGRNIRASYGTSKYCSAFIKNVRCNNPECTYLHSMGEAEDTFTKQEIQAGYVTSGRDVLLRQQQIVAQALADGRTAGSRRKVGGGGPSGTGRHSSHPVFPAPSYDEPPRASSALVGVPPPQGPSGRSLSVGAGFSAVASGQVSGGKIVRASSMSSSPPTTSLAVGGLSALKTPTNRKIVTSLGGLASPAGTSISGSVIGAPSGATAASVVAGVHSLGGSSAPAPAPHTTLTPLTPLKRTTQTKVGVPKPSSLDALGGASLTGLRAAPVQKTSLSIGPIGTAPTSPSSSLGSSKNDYSSEPIGGTVIGGGAIGPRSGVGALSVPSESLSTASFSAQSLSGDPRGRMNNLGGDVFTGDVRSNHSVGGGDRWVGAGVTGDPIIGPRATTNLGSLWETSANGSGGGMLGVTGPIGGPQKVPGSVGRIGGAPIGTPIGAPKATNGSSALASMLGISLPTGTGSLQESSSLWGASNQSPTPVSSLGGHASVGGSGLLGGVPAGRGAAVGGATIGGVRSFSASQSIGSVSSNPKPINGSGSNNSDIALLQSLLPGVHITSGDAGQPAVGGFGSAGGGNWHSGNWNGSGGGGLPQPVGAPTVGGGVIGATAATVLPAKAQKEQNQPSIW